MLAQALVPEQLQLSLLEWLNDVELENQKSIVKARNYHDGEHLVFLTDRLRQFLNADGADITFRMNVCRIVVEAVAERLIVKGFDSADAKLKAWAEELWQANRMDAKADDVHEEALRDGEGFVMVDWDDAVLRVRMTPHPRFASVEAGGDGFGFQMAYPDGDVSQAPVYALKRWVETIAAGVTRSRATFYYPDRIEKFTYNTGGWQPVQDEGDEAWPIPWLTTDGKPLGIPIIHFKNKSLRSEAWDAIPIQDGINKTFVDLLASADLTAFRIFVALGFIPTTDGRELAADQSNALVIEPGQMIGTTKPAGAADFKAIDGQDPTPILNMLQKLVLFLAMVTNTPAGRFQVTGLVAAEGTLKQQDEPLMAKVRLRQVVFGDAWEDVFTIARRLAAKFGTEKLSEDAALSTQWQDAQTRTDAERQAEWKAKKELGIPRRQLWSEMGYTPEKIAEMLNDPEVVNGSFASFP